MRLEIELDEETAARFKRYVAKVRAHRRADPAFMGDETYSIEEAGTCLVRYGLDMVSMMTAAEEQRLSLPGWLQVLAVERRDRRS